ncbi:hypothetical protein BGZ96_004695, partial [Linnemannia gamsii]
MFEASTTRPTHACHSNLLQALLQDHQVIEILSTLLEAKGLATSSVGSITGWAVESTKSQLTMWKK